MNWYNVIKGLTPEEEEAANNFLIDEVDLAKPVDTSGALSIPQSWQERPRPTGKITGTSFPSSLAEKEISNLLEEIEAAQQEIKDLRKLVEEEE